MDFIHQQHHQHILSGHILSRRRPGVISSMSADMCSCCYSSIRPVPCRGNITASNSQPHQQRPAAPATASLRFAHHGMHIGLATWSDLGIGESLLCAPRPYGSTDGHRCAAMSPFGTLHTQAMVAGCQGGSESIGRIQGDRIRLHARLLARSLVASGTRRHLSDLTCGRRTQKC